MQLLLLPFQFLSVSSREHTMDLITLNFLEIPSTLMTKPLISTFGNYQEILLKFGGPLDLPLSSI